MVLFTVTCSKRAAQPGSEPVAPGQRVEADVVTIREVLPEEKKAFIWLIPHAGGKVRLGNEADRWRLIDLEAGTVTFVDEPTRSYKTETIAALREARRRAIMRPLPPPFRPMSYVHTEDAAVIAGRRAVKHVVTGGGYHRELWLSSDPVIHPDLYTAIVASDTVSEPFAGLMREVTPELMKQQGFPLRDESELSYGEKKMHVIRTVTEIGRRSVPASWFSIPEDYEDRGVKVPGDDRPSGASRPSGRGTRGAGSQSSATN